MKKVSYFLTGIIFLVSCSNNSEQSGYKGNMSELVGWVKTELIKEVNLPEHPYAVFVDSSTEYSYGFTMLYKDIQPSKPKKAEISCNIFPYNLPNNVQLVFEMKEGDNNIYWTSAKIEKGKVGEWNNVILKADIPQNLPPNVVIKVYLWSPSKETALGDNFCIKFE